MPLCLINVEQTGPERWSVEMEAGHGWRFKAKRFTATSFDDMIEQIIDTYREQVPVEPPKPPVVPSPPLVAFPVDNPTRVPRQRRQRRGSRGEMLR